MDNSWSVGVLPDGVENVQPLAEGNGATMAAAVAAATEALVDATRSRGRQEYRVAIAEKRIMIVPALGADGVVDLDELRGALSYLII